jgi:DNA invertase Pin-like site-specific DNA recombinase
VLYHRVSTREQNPRLARAELRAAAATRGLRVVLEVEETASGRGSVRPGLARVLAAVERGAIDVVLVQRLDRWGRSTLGSRTCAGCARRASASSRSRRGSRSAPSPTRCRT